MITKAIELDRDAIAIDNVFSPLFTSMADVISWLTGVAPLSSCLLRFRPVSFHLIGPSQFTQDLVVARVSGLLPAALRASFRTR
jgi:hypothetical protein